jgi:hypothetical protein
MKLICNFSAAVKLVALCLATGLLGGLYVGSAASADRPTTAPTDTHKSAPAPPGVAPRSGGEVLSWRPM